MNMINPFPVSYADEHRPAGDMTDPCDGLGACDTMLDDYMHAQDVLDDYGINAGGIDLFSSF